ncbi:MAG: pilus assembly protein TadG-related protein [Gemmatimonadaceae bacterium]
MSRMHARRGSRRGAVLVMVAVLLTVLLGFGAFAIDLSQVMAHRSELQRAADAAALAAVVQLTTSAPDSADEVARAYSAANPVMGNAPTVVSAEYGRWNGITFDSFPCSFQPTGCVTGDAYGAGAFRLRVSSVSPAIFGQLLGVVSSTVKAEAVAWTSPNVEVTDCLKPVVMPYQALTATINPFLRPGANVNLNRNLTLEDHYVLRSNPAALKYCAKEGELCDTPAPGEHASRFLVVDVGGGQASVAANIMNCVPRRFGPDSVLQVLSSGNWNSFGAMQTGRTQWCTQYGSLPCKMKVALWDTVAATSPQCASQVTGTESCVIYRIASLVVTGEYSSPSSDSTVVQPRVVLQGYFGVAIDHGNVGTRPTTLTRPVLVQ